MDKKERDLQVDIHDFHEFFSYVIHSRDKRKKSINSCVDTKHHYLRDVDNSWDVIDVVWYQRLSMFPTLPTSNYKKKQLARHRI